MLPLRVGCRSARSIKTRSLVEPHPRSFYPTLDRRPFTSNPVTHVRRRRGRQDAQDPFHELEADVRNEKNLSRNLDDEDFSLNMFEESVGAGSRKRRRIDPAQQGSSMEQSLQRRLDSLTQEMKDTSMPEDDPQEVARRFFPEDVLQRMNDAPLMDLMSYQITPQDPIPRQSQVFVNQLNTCLDDAMVDPQSEAAQRSLWRWYERSKNNVPGLLRMIPRACWDLLWQTQSMESPSNPDRASHMKILAQDKRSAGWELNEQERCAEIEGMFLEGDQAKALGLLETILAGDESPSLSLLEMGVRMHARHGDPERASVLLEQYFQRDSTADPRLAIRVINSFSAQRSEVSLQKAWTLYRQLQQRLAGDMDIGDYDYISLGFLAAGQKDFALAVFRDMMLHGDHDAQREVQAFAKVGEFVSLGSAQESTALSLDAIKYLPRRFQNKFFYASWLRRLIAEGQLNAAGQVVELMYERNVAPSPKHLNGLISAWLKNGTPNLKRKAEELGWTMIQARVDFVKRRRSTGQDEALVPTKSVTQNAEGIRIPVSVQRPVPPGSIETFCVLLQYYLRRGQFEHARHLRNLLVDAELPMNSFFMNHLLYAERRNRGYRMAWSRFGIMSRNVTPDVETWVCLWECMKQHLSDSNTDRSGFPMPRELFKIMHQWFESLQGQQRRYAFEDMSHELYLDIIRGFCYAKDLPGSFVAMQTMKEMFGIYPNEETSKALVKSIAALDKPQREWRPERRFHRRVARKTPDEDDESISKATQMLDIVRRHRQDKLAELGCEIANMDERQLAEEAHRAWLALLFAVIKRKEAGSREPKTAIHIASEQMGTGELDVDKAMAIVVTQ